MVPRSLASGHECRIDRDFPPPMRIVAVLVWRRGGGQGDFRSDAAAASVRGGRPTGARSRPTRRPLTNTIFPGSEETIPLGAGPVSSWMEARSRLVSVRGPPGAVEQHFGHDDAIAFDAFVLLISDSSSLDARPVTPAPAISHLSRRLIRPHTRSPNLTACWIEAVRGVPVAAGAQCYNFHFVLDSQREFQKASRSLP